MDNDRIKKLTERTQLRTRTRDVPIARALAAAAEQTGQALPHIPLTEHSAPMLFDAVYKALRQIGDGHWWLLGYEPRTHDVSIELLIDLDPAIAQKMERFKQLRHDAAYRGSKISTENAQEIITFWNAHGGTLLEKLKREAV